MQCQTSSLLSAGCVQNTSTGRIHWGHPEKMLNCFNYLLSTLGAAVLLWAPPESLVSSGWARHPVKGNSFQLILSRHHAHDQRCSTHMSHSLSERNHTLLTFCCWRVRNNHIWYRNLLKLHTEVIFSSFPPVHHTHTLIIYTVIPLWRDVWIIDPTCCPALMLTSTRLGL